MVQPLDGVRIVDLTALVFGPLATKMLADLGAEVVKIEPLDGELTRHIEPMRSKAMGALFMHLNRGKKSVAIDLKDDRGRRIVGRLATTADVFVHSMRQPAIERLGLDYPALKAQNPEIVYCAAWGFDRRGPFADHPAYDDIIQAASGLASLAGDADGTPRYARTIIADKVGGLFAANAIMAALLHRRETGRGQFVEVPMMECLSWFVLAEHLGGASFEPATGPPGHRRALVDSRRPFATRDSHIAALPYTTAQWQRFLRHIGRDDLADADWVADTGQRTMRIGELYEVVDAAMPQQTTAEWMAVLGGLDIPAMPVNDLAGLLEDPQLAASGFFEHYDHPSEGRLMGTAFPVRFSEMPDRAPAVAPRIGEHTRSILERLDYDDDGIGDLIAAGVVAEP
jgi:crotonobetainyl-CoA:carnitine CoA-transferase CaiB-like acyl-CoA transferase